MQRHADTAARQSALCTIITKSASSSNNSCSNSCGIFVRREVEPIERAKEREQIETGRFELRLEIWRSEDALKILFFDGSGMAIFYKRFDRGVVRLPTDLPPGTKQLELDDASLEALLDGIELEEKPASKRRRAIH